GIERSAGELAQFCIWNKRSPQSSGRIQHDKIEAEFAKPLVQQLGQHRRSPIQRIARGRSPPNRLIEPAFAPFLEWNGEMPDFGRPGLETLKGFSAAETFEIVIELRSELDPMAIRIDHRMVQARTQLRRLGAAVGHGLLPLPKAFSTRRIGFTPSCSAISTIVRPVRYPGRRCPRVLCRHRAASPSNRSDYK